MEHFFHIGPPLAFGLVGQGFLAGLANVPPFLCHRIGGHLRHVGGKVAACIHNIIGRAVSDIPQPDFEQLYTSSRPFFIKSLESALKLEPFVY